jgi:hypothetical protein
LLRGGQSAALPRTRPLDAVSVSVGPYRLPVYLACTVLALLIDYVLGKDMAWDTLNYHLYAGFSAVNDRFAQDYFAAGPVSYLNPYIYIAFYALVRAGLPAIEISFALAVVHSVILWLTFELAVAVYPPDDPRKSATVGICAVMLALINPILLQEIGSSLTDITTGVPVLAGWVLLVRAVREPRLAQVAWAGVLLGAASALKLTNAVHAIGALGILLILPGIKYDRIRGLLCYIIALGLSFGVVAAPWSYRLAKMFGNPLFPLMNGVFRSPDFTAEPLHHLRFIPATLGEALWRPFAISDPVRMVHEELRAPDLRYAVLTLLGGALLSLWMWRRFTRSGQTVPVPLSSAPRALTALGCGFALDWVLWLSGSGNGRYFLPMSSVAGVLLAVLLFLYLRPMVRNYFLIAIVGAQSIQLWMGAEYRWNPVPWDAQWFNLSVPGQLATEPNLYLTLGVQSNSFLAPFLARDSGLVNFSGGYVLGPDGANGRHVEGLIRRYAPHLRMLVRGRRLHADSERLEPTRSRVDAALERFDLRVDPSDCATIIVHGLPPPIEITFKGVTPAEPRSGDTTYLLSCHLLPDDTDHAETAARQRAADLVLDHLEDACPQLFQPRRLRSEPNGGAWQRLYFNTDLIAWVSLGGVKFRDVVRGDTQIFLGRESDWAKAPPRLRCGRRDGHAFAQVVEAKVVP